LQIKILIKNKYSEGSPVSTPELNIIMKVSSFVSKAGVIKVKYIVKNKTLITIDNMKGEVKRGSLKKIADILFIYISHSFFQTTYSLAFTDPINL
jgi:hypothetical protein